MVNTNTYVIIIQICACSVFLSNHEIGYKSRYGSDWKVLAGQKSKHRPAVLEAIHLRVSCTGIAYIKACLLSYQLTRNKIRFLLEDWLVSSTTPLPETHRLVRCRVSINHIPATPSEPAPHRPYNIHHTVAIRSKIANRYDVRWKPLVPYVVYTNSALQVEFTECKWSYTSIKIT